MPKIEEIPLSIHIWNIFFVVSASFLQQTWTICCKLEAFLRNFLCLLSKDAQNRGNSFVYRCFKMLWTLNCSDLTPLKLKANGLLILAESCVKGLLLWMAVYFCVRHWNAQLWVYCFSITCLQHSTEHTSRVFFMYIPFASLKEYL